MTELKVTPHANNFGACIEGVDIAGGLDADTIAQLRQAWLDYQIIYLPDQPLDHEQLKCFTRYFGDHGNDPYVKAIDGHQHILEVRREADEKVAPFGGGWHSDWSFQSEPPAATLLHAKVVPPQGGDTLYADCIRAYEALDTGLAAELAQLQTIHSARRPYSHEGYVQTGGDQRTSMTILPNDNAWDTQLHPLVRTHPESGRKALWINPIYTIAIDGMDDSESNTLLAKLFDHLLQPDFILTHRWSANMLTMWDNRSALHCAQGGYDGYQRIMHRTTVAGTVPA